MQRTCRLCFWWVFVVCMLFGIICNLYSLCTEASTRTVLIYKKINKKSLFIIAAAYFCSNTVNLFGIHTKAAFATHCASELWCICRWNWVFNKQNVGQDLILSIWNWLDCKKNKKINKVAVMYQNGDLESFPMWLLIWHLQQPAYLSQSPDLWMSCDWSCFIRRKNTSLFNAGKSPVSNSVTCKEII